MILKARPIIKFNLKPIEVAVMSTNTLQKHQCTMSHHYHVHSDLEDPPRTKALILYWRTNGVGSGRR